MESTKLGPLVEMLSGVTELACLHRWNIQRKMNEDEENINTATTAPTTSRDWGGRCDSVTVWRCDCVTVLLFDYVTVWQCDCVTVCDCVTTLYKEYGGFLAIRTNIVRVQLFELIDIIGKIWGQIYTANFFCSLIFNKWSLSNFALHVLIQCKTVPGRISRTAGSVRAGHQVDWYSWAESEDRSEHLLVGSAHTTFRDLHCSK